MHAFGHGLHRLVGEPVRVVAEQVQQGGQLLGREHAGPREVAEGLGVHLGGRAHAAADAVEARRAVCVRVGQGAGALPQGLRDGRHLALGRQDGGDVVRIGGQRPLRDADVGEVAPVLDARELG